VPQVLFVHTAVWQGFSLGVQSEVVTHCGKNSLLLPWAPALACGVQTPASAVVVTSLTPVSALSPKTPQTEATNVPACTVIVAMLLGPTAKGTPAAVMLIATWFASIEVQLNTPAT